MSFSTLLGVLAGLLKLIMFLAERTRDLASEEKGYALAVKDVLDEAHKDLAWADAERVLIAQGHTADPSDAAFDSDYRRP